MQKVPLDQQEHAYGWCVLFRDVWRAQILGQNRKAEFFCQCKSCIGCMREQGVPPSCGQPLPLEDPLKPLQQSAVPSGCFPCSPLPPRLAGHKPGCPAAPARQGDRGEGRLHSPVTSRQNNSWAVWGGRKLRQLITCIPAYVRTERSGSRGCRSTHSYGVIDRVVQYQQPSLEDNALLCSGWR